MPRARIGRIGAFVLAVAVLAAAVVLRYSLARSTPEAAHRAQASPQEQRSSRTRHVVNFATQEQDETSAATEAHGDRESALDVERSTRGPSAAVWDVLKAGYTNVAEERQKFISALSSASACAAKWCADGRETLSAWVTTIATQLPEGVSTDSIQCSAAGCWTQLVVMDPRKQRELLIAVDNAIAAKSWKGPSIRSGFDSQSQRGKMVSLVAILPDENETTTITNVGER